MSPISTLYGLDKHVHESRFSLRRICKLIAPGFIYTIVVGLTGCATSAELESLRVEVAKVNATAVRAEAELSRTQHELATLRSAARPPDIFSEPRALLPAPLTKSNGYKWGKHPQD